MTLQSSGAISLANIQTEFGGSNPIGLNEYYGADTGVPASGSIALSHFYGKKKKTYTTFDAATKASTSTLSNGNLTTTGTARSALGIAAGKWYVELTFSGATSTSSGLWLGVTNYNTTMPWNQIYGAAWSFFEGGNTNWNATGRVISVGSAVDWPANFDTAIIGIAINKDAGTATLTKNGAYWTPAISLPTGVNYVFAGMIDPPGTITANFGATPFTYTPPAGFNPGLYA